MNSAFLPSAALATRDQLRHHPDQDLHTLDLHVRLPRMSGERPSGSKGSCGGGEAQVGEELDERECGQALGAGWGLAVEALARQGLLVAGQEVRDEVEVCRGAGVHAGPGHGLDELARVGLSTVSSTEKA